MQEDFLAAVLELLVGHELPLTIARLRRLWVGSSRHRGCSAGSVLGD
jgi:hypothetical protein